MGFDALQQQVAGLFEEWVDRDIKAFVVWCKGSQGQIGVVRKGGERCWEIEGGFLRRLLRELMEERRQKVRVVDLDG
jgi:CO dehydrogenase nickel-insertion accessory protein CooC1